MPIAQQNLETLVWDRELLQDAMEKHSYNPGFKYEPFDEIFLGHTTTQMFGITEPLHFCNVWALDTGAGWSGKLTMMNVETKKYWQSDLTSSLYGPLGRSVSK